MFEHYSVLLTSVANFLPDNGKKLNVLDCTGGGGGHSDMILERIGSLVERIDILEWDLETFLALKNKYQNNPKVVVYHLNFKDAKQLKRRYDFLLADLGLNNQQLRDLDRGFSWQDNSNLDMRIDQSSTELTALDILNSYSQAELAEIFYYYGELDYAKKLAKSIVSERHRHRISPDIFWEIIDKFYFPRKSRLNPRTLAIQALRIEVNQELLNLQSLLQDLDSLLRPQAVAVFISFHSLEDRLVKQFFKKLSLENNYELLTKKPLKGKDLDNNSNARSAKLRAIKKIK